MCEYDPNVLKKLEFTGNDGKKYFGCFGQTTCQGKQLTVSCSMKDLKEKCPMKKACVVFPMGVIPGDIPSNIINFDLCYGMDSDGNNIYWSLTDKFYKKL